MIEKQELLAQTSELIPVGAKLLYECFVVPDEEMAAFEECYLLVRPHPSKLGTHRVIGMFIYGPYMYDNTASLLTAMRAWLQSPETSTSYCQEVQEKEEKGVKKFMPNKFPRDYYFYAQEVSFMEVFPQ